MEDKRLETIQEALKVDESLSEKLIESNSVDDIKNIMSAIGVEFSDVEAKELIEAFRNHNDRDELSVDEMDSVNGGFAGVVVAVAIVSMTYTLYKHKQNKR